MGGELRAAGNRRAVARRVRLPLTARERSSRDDSRPAGATVAPMSGRARGALWTALVAASVLVPAPVASAATVFLEAPAPWTTTHALRYTATPGERNNLSI